MKYKYTIRQHTVDGIESLETILNKYGSQGIRVTKVEKTDNLVYEGGLSKYTVYLEEKIKKVKKIKQKKGRLFG